MTDDLSWIDHPANIRANAVLLRIVADQSLLHAAELERLRALLQEAIPYIEGAQNTTNLEAHRAAGELLGKIGETHNATRAR